MLVRFFAFVPLAASLFGSFVDAGPLDVQFRQVDFQTGIVELVNFGDTDEPLDGWRFCTHNENQQFRYSPSSGLNGITLGPGESLFIHYNDDATADANSLNVSDLGGFATPLSVEAYALGIYWPEGGGISFGSAADLADHMQWSLDGNDNDQADPRSGVAETAGLWSADDAWIPTNADTPFLRLVDDPGGLHGADSYAAVIIDVFCDRDGDLDCDTDDADNIVNAINAGTADQNDLDQFLTIAADLNGFSSSYLLGDANLDGTVDSNDLNAVGVNWQQTTNGWSDGDFVPDGEANSLDLNVVGINWQQSVAQASSVPEPSSICSAIGFLLVFLSFLRRRSSLQRPAP